MEKTLLQFKKTWDEELLCCGGDVKTLSRKQGSGRCGVVEFLYNPFTPKWRTLHGGNYMLL